MSSFFLRLGCLVAMGYGVVGQVFGVSVTSFSPPVGSAGDPVTIYGTGFDPAGTLVVKFHGVQDFTAQVTAADGTVIQAQVPAGAPLGAAPITVQINGGTPAASLDDFTVVGPGPFITNFSPSAGGAGTMVFIDGLHFANPSLATGAYFNGKAGTGFFVQSDSRIVVNAPAGVTTGPISVRSPQGTNTTSTNFFVPPVVVGFSPTSGRAGTNVLITGTNLLGTLAVRFGGIFASNINVLSNGAALVTVPSNALTGPVRLDAPAGSFTTTSNFVVQPTVFGFNPAFGPPTTSVTITGANLLGTTSIKFNGVNASFSGASTNQVTATVPSAATSGPISVTTTNGTTASASNFYVPASISSFTPTNSPTGSRVTITGVNFTNASAVSFSGVLATNFTVTNNTTIGATVPSGVSTGPISVTTPAGTTNSTGLFYAPPGITSFAPTHGLPGTNVTITGSNLLGTTAVKFNGSSGTFNVSNNTTLVAVVPNSAQTGPITVIAPAGTNTSSSNFVLDYFSDLVVSIGDSPDPVAVGSNLVYTVSILNNGPFNATNVTLTSQLPTSVTLKGASTTQGSLATNGNSIIASLGGITTAGSASLTLTVVPQLAGSITNIASGMADNTDPSPGNNSFVAITTVLPLPLLSISKSSSNQVRISWPASLTNYLLQFKNALGTNTNWSNVTAAPSNVGAQKVTTETISNSSRFYRLIR